MASQQEEVSVNQIDSGNADNQVEVMEEAEEVQIEQEASVDETLEEGTPYIGMEFESTESAYQFYLRYAYRVGFGVSKNGGSSKNGICSRFIVVCHKSGQTRSESNKPVNERNRLQIKTGCPAGLTFRFDISSKVWKVVKCELQHNHELCPEYSNKLRCFRGLKEHVKRQLELNEHAGVPAIANINAVTHMAGGDDYCGFTERDARNYIAKIRRKSFQKGDAQALMDLFQNLKKKDPNFYFSWKFDEENRLERVFWVDSISRASYEFFGDVLSFDTTYIVNK